MKSKNLYKSLYILVLIIFLVLQIFSFYIESDMWWDSSVYIGVGKYIYSSGKAGLWESSRPLIWPLIIGFFWKIGTDYTFYSKLTLILFGVGSVVLTYKITTKLFNENIAFYTVLFLCLSRTFFIFNSVLQTEIPSMFFFLLGYYFFIQKKRKLSGFFFGITFMTRFFQIFLIIPIMLSYLSLVLTKKERTKDFILFLLSFFAPIVPYLISNIYLYNSMLYPFALQVYMTKNTGWIFNQPILFYFANLLKENFLVIFSIFGMVTLLSIKNFEKKMFLFVLLFPFVLYNLIKHKEMRLLISLLPFLYAITSQGIVSFFEEFNKYKNKLITVLVGIFLIQAFYQLEFNKYEDNLDPFYDYISSTEVKDKIWISNPSFIAFTNYKADELMYYPLYNSHKARELQAKAENAEAVLINTCDIYPCPLSDTSCYEETDNLINILKEKLRLIHDSKRGNCRYLIFEK